MDTYTITYTNGNTTTFTVTNGEDSNIPTSDYEALKQEVEDLRNNQLTNTPAKSTSYHIVDSAKAKLRRFLPEGHSEQETTVGKQLIGIADGTYSTTAGSITFKDGIGTISVASGVSSNFGMSIPLITPIKLKANQAYTRINNSGSAYPYLTLYDEVYHTLDNMSASDNGLKVYTPTEDEEVYYIYFWINYNQNNTVIKPMMVEGSYTASTMPEFEKFTYGASPNPNWEQPIKSCGDNVNKFDKDAVSLGYIDFRDGTFTAYNTYTSSDFIEIEPNFSYYCNWTPYTSTAYGLAYYDSDKQYLSGSKLDVLNNVIPPVNNAKYIRFCVRNEGDKATDINQLYLKKGTTPQPYSPYGMGSINEYIVNKNLFVIKNYSKSGWIITIDNPLKNMTAGNYTISCQNKYASSGKSIRTYFSNAVAGEAIGSVFTDYSFGNTVMSQAKSLTQEQLNAKYFILYPNDNAGSQSVLEDMQIMIEQGSTATDYVPHEEQTYSIYTQQPFRSIGDVRDCFVKKSDGWYERHKIKRLIFDGTENWQFDPSHYRFLILLSESQLSTNRSGKSNYFKIGNTETTNNCFSFSTTAVLFRVDETITSKADAKSWVATKYADGRPLYTDYILAEPLDLPCTEEQIQQLENRPSTYKVETNVISENEVEAYIDAEYVIDLKTYIDNK